MTDEELEQYLDALGEEMRPAADLIISLRKEWEAMPARTARQRKEKFAKEKTISKLERDFAVAFNRDDCFGEYCWPDGLTVRFVPPPVIKRRDGTMRLRTGREGLIGPAAAPHPAGLVNVGVRPIFSRPDGQ
jgi:hypothetical protein